MPSATPSGGPPFWKWIASYDRAARRWRFPFVGGLGKVVTRRGLYRHLEREVRSGTPAGGRILSVGAGGGVEAAVRAAARTLNARVTTLDIDPARKPDIVADLHDYTSDDRYDCVVLSEVLEHLHTPQRALDALRALCLPGATVLITTPFLFPLHDEPADYYRYTQYGLRHLLRSYDVQSMVELGGWAESLVVLASRVKKGMTGPPKFLIGLPLLFASVVALPAAVLVDRVFPNAAFTVRYLVVCRTPGEPSSTGES